MKRPVRVHSKMILYMHLSVVVVCQRGVACHGIIRNGENDCTSGNAALIQKIKTFPINRLEPSRVHKKFLACVVSSYCAGLGGMTRAGVGLEWLRDEQQQERCERQEVAHGYTGVYPHAANISFGGGRLFLLA